MFYMRYSINGLLSKLRNPLPISNNTISSFYTSPFNLKGHSKWQNIKDIKGKNDLIKAKKTNFLLGKMKSAVKEGGFDLKTNKKLNDLQLEFKNSCLSLDVFNGFLKKIKEKPEIIVHYDVIGPSGSLFIIECETDNYKKTESSLRSYLNKIENFRLTTNSLKSRFEEKGVITISNLDKEGKTIKIDVVEEAAIEFDVEEILEIENDNDSGNKQFELYCDKKDLYNIESKISENRFVVDNAEIRMKAIDLIPISEDDMKKVEKFYELLMDKEYIKNIFSNVEEN